VRKNSLAVYNILRTAGQGIDIIGAGPLKSSPKLPGRVGRLVTAPLTGCT